MQSELVISLNHVLVPIQDLSQPLLWALYLSQFFAYRTQLVFHVLVSEASECANSNNVTLPLPFVTQSQQSKMPIPGRSWFTLSLWQNSHTVPFAMWRSRSGSVELLHCLLGMSTVDEGQLHDHSRGYHVAYQFASEGCVQKILWHDERWKEEARSQLLINLMIIFFIDNYKKGKEGSISPSNG